MDDPVAVGEGERGVRVTSVLWISSASSEYLRCSGEIDPMASLSGENRILFHGAILLLRET